MIEPDRSEIERFVRGTLGCGCPEEVFRAISISRLPEVPGQPRAVQLVIGSRLLIHVVAAPANPSTDWLERLAANGRAARDRHGYNRFRLVLLGGTPDALPADLGARFARAIARDERAHLHLLDPAQVPAALAPGT